MGERNDDLPYMSIFVRDVLADFADLDDAERGAALSLMLACWAEGGAIDADPRRLARRAGTDPAQWPARWGAIARFFAVDGSRVTNPMVTVELSRARAQLEKRQRIADETNAKRAAKRSGQCVADRDADRDGERTPSDTLTVTQTETPPSPSPSPSPSQSQSRDPDPAQEITKSAETAPPSSPPVLVFPCDGTVREWGLSQEQIDDWTKAFPSLDVLGCCRAAHAWVNAAPQRRKTSGGMSRFLVGWLTRTQERGGGVGTPTRPAPQGDVRFGHMPAEVKPRPNGRVAL